MPGPRPATARARVSMSCSENSTSSAVATAGLSSMTRTVVGMRLAYRQALRVAMAGEMLAARQAGPYTARTPSSHSATEPAAR